MPLNTRQRIILDLLAKVQKPIGRTKLMKMLFLFRQQTSRGVSSYDFVPYKYGPYSFEAAHDLHYSLARFIISEEKSVTLRDDVHEEVQSNISRIPISEQKCITEIWQRYTNMSLDQLLNHVYENYPWYASRSLLADKVKLSSRVVGCKAVYTIGYEGVSIDAFFNCLLVKGVEGIIDVRRNAYSQKLTFCDHGLKRVCAKLGLAYHHIPELGIESRLRKELKTPEEHGRMFADYEEQVVSLEAPLQQASNLLQTRPSSLLCFEATADRCHRGRLAPVLAKLTGLPIVHL